MRSTQTPAGRVKRRNGRNCTVVRLATANALAFRFVIAIHGIASCETGVPNSLIVCPAHSFMKSG
jgi:hypothetical protein